ncbi:MAG: NADH-quinone oxidoreductase subunit L [Bacteroidetes bacterium B1(2017)]|nr:MAG: NADH-quinone oxidoreductase subunit L [Bacteroidetes bacterium B1(2017)]
MDLRNYIILIPTLPLLSFLLLGIFANSVPFLRKMAGYIGSACMFIAFYLSCTITFTLSTKPLALDVSEHFTWLNFGSNLSIDMGYWFTPVSGMMLVVVTFISLMVHVFSLGYMHGEKRFATYYAFLGLFTFSMLGLVLSSNIFQIYMFWELVGVSSFLLIGYYFEKPSAVAAAKKAFIVTRFADLGFLIGILALGYYSETFDFKTLIQRLTDQTSPQFVAASTASFMGISALSWGLILVFMGGAGKSAMFPLHIWLPDAMEGPTPVSALIHAATMVVAGVYLVARLFPIFVIDAAVMQVVAYTGITSALFAAIIACTQTDIKRVLAYSTMSQIGFMMFALGVSGYSGESGAGFSASLFHLFTHAFFKSLLFLGAGAIIHMVHSNEMEDMGGLRKHMPITHASFLIACLAISGIPPFAGFFSKEAILHAAHNSNPGIYYIALFTSMLTAFYMFRLYYSIFWSTKEAKQHHTHGEGTWSMKGPLILLALASILVGFVPFSTFISADGIGFESHLDWMFSILPVTLAAVGIGFATYLYAAKNDKPQAIATSLGSVYTAAKKKFYIDEVYLFITQKVLFNLIGRPAAWIDKHIVDGFYSLTALVTAEFSSTIKGFQSGNVQGYALYFLGGIMGLAVLIMYVLK